MAEKKTAPADTGTLKIIRIFNAPVELVWKAWSDPEHLMKWWGPKDFTSPTCKMDFRTGGKYLFCMRGPDGKDYWSTGTYSEIVPKKRIVCSDSFADEKGNVVDASYYGFPDPMPLVLQITLEFEESDGKTIMTLTHTGFPKGTMGEQASSGWNQSLDKLEATLTSMV